MDVPGDQRTQTGVQRAKRAAPRTHRRPSGEAPPLPYHLQTSGIGWLVAVVVLIVLTLAVFGGGMRGAAVAVTAADDAVAEWLSGLDAFGLEPLLQGLARIGSWWVLFVVWGGLIVALLVLRRWRHLIVWLIVFFVGAQIIYAVASMARRPRPFGVDLRASWGGWAMPSMQMAVMSAVLMAVLYTLVPEGRARNIGKWVAAALITVVGVARVALGVDAPTDVLVAVGIGVALPLLAFRRFTPSEVFPVAYKRGRSAHLDVGGVRGMAIRRALEDQLGVTVKDVKPFGLAGSAGSTPLRITVEGVPPRQLFGKLYAQSHLRADRWYKLGRELLYGRLEDERPFNTVRRLVQQEDYALSLMQRAGLPSPTPYGFVELTPEREYLLVTEFFEGAVELGETAVDDEIIDEGLRIIRKLWDAGLAHRDIKPANLLVRDGRMLLIDVAFVEARPTPWRQAVDLANMMLCLALRSSPERVYERALRQFTIAEITEGFAAARGLALPSQLRRMLREESRDLHAEYIKLLPSPPQPIRIQRWSLRRIGLWVAIVLLLLLPVRFPGMFFDNEVAVASPLEIDNLDCTHLEPQWLMAQSVPSASLVPCVRTLPTGWSIANVTANDGRSTITFDHDRAGDGALRVRLAATCDTASANQQPSSTPGIRRFERVEGAPDAFAATWYADFRGGCVTYRLQSTDDPAGGFAGEIDEMLNFTTRDTLREALQERSNGRLQLDPRQA
jgi:tRNA A-37 threonylcarbamoyl transferase component Bud32/membrane-associated phospholipid phosphatase